MSRQSNSHHKLYDSRRCQLALDWFQEQIEVWELREEMNYPKKSNVGPYLFAAMTLREAVRRGDVELVDKRRD